MHRLRRTSVLNSTRLWLSDSLLGRMTTEADRCWPLETGGMLLGYERCLDGIEHLVIKELIGPGPAAVHRRRRFEPDHQWQVGRLHERYEGSGRTITYLGDWHTHPGGWPSPSGRDTKTARAIGRRAAARMPQPLMLILAGGGDAGWTGRSYRLLGRRLRMLDEHVSRN